MNHSNGWTLGTLQDVIASVRGGFSVNCEDRNAKVGELGVLKTGAVLKGSFDPSQNKFVPENERTRLRSPVTANTIIICRKNSEETIGASALVENDCPNLFLSDLLWELRPAPQTNKHWLLNVLQSSPVRSTIRLWSTGTQSTMKNISQDRLLAIPIQIPPSVNQFQIAEILRTWDAAIQKAEALNKAKQTQYDAVSRRFFEPCHPSSTRGADLWAGFSMGDLFRERIQQGSGNDTLLSITMSEGLIDRDGVGRKDSSSEDKSQYKLVLPGDIGYNTMRMWQGVSGLSSLRGIVSPAYTVLIPDQRRISSRYAEHLFKSKRMIHDFERYSQGLTSDTWNLKFPAFAEIKVYLPPVDKQDRQANLLDALRSEVSVLKRRCEALNAQKRGLMQKLLTSEWRVPC